MTEGEMADDIIDSVDMSFSKLWEIVKLKGKPGGLQSMKWGLKESETTELLNNK